MNVFVHCAHCVFLCYLMRFVSSFKSNLSLKEGDFSIASNCNTDTKPSEDTEIL